MASAERDPRWTWGKLVKLGKILRDEVTDDAAGNGSATGGSDDEVQRFVAGLNDLSAADKRERVEQACTRTFGSLGRLALCNLGSVSRPAGVLMAATHALILHEARARGTALACTGATEEDAGDAWNSEEEWPELLPQGWKRGDSSFSFRYSTASGSGRRRTFVVKGVPMGASTLLVSAMELADEGSSSSADSAPASCGLSVGDFVATSHTADTIRSALTGASGHFADGLCGLLTRASAVQLASVVNRQLLDALLGSAGHGAGRGMSGGHRSAVPRWPGETPQPGHGGRRGSRDGEGLGGVPIGGPAAGFGDPDLYPSFGGIPPGGGGGGMFFGPGNPRFDGHFGGPPRPGFPGVPPGARFDPFGPPGLGPRGPPGAGGRGGRGSRGGFGGGEPDPDHLRPPHGADDMYF